VAPPEWAAPLIADDAGLFTIGPLTGSSLSITRGRR
jgi:hypothetical protein